MHAPVVLTCVDVRQVRDGDTLTCVTADPRRPRVIVRVAGLDAPESGQAYSRVARQRLQQLATAGTRVECYKRDQHGRSVCRVSTPDGQDAVELLLRAGLAWHDQRFRSEQTRQEQARYAAAEQAARNAKAGLWRLSDPQPPWECRRLRERQQACR